jgi:hypothetical protein
MKPATKALKREKLLPIATLLCAYVGVVFWFRHVDFYHRHFFDTGVVTFADNLVRVVFVAILSWLIYAPGAAVVALLSEPDELSKLTSPERAVLGFGVGVGLWHVAMLVLGETGLYYRAVIETLCLVALVASAPHFGSTAIAVWRRRKDCLCWGDVRNAEMVGAALIAVAGFWLLLVRGLYPGGNGDYYTHYFHYYLEVLKNHGLAPNDVWYHYYYSKGSGLAFLAMLLTDPEAPALATFVCVLVAAIAIATLSQRLVPRSLWPLAGALIFLLFYLVSLSWNGGGEFQKDHEEVTALISLIAWGMCMERYGPSRPFLIMIASCAVAATILTLAAGVMIGVCISLLSLGALLRKRWGELWGYGLIVAGIAVTMLSLLALNYFATGLGSDQALDLMLRFANFSRLDRWGVIPQVIAVAWIRDNYAALTPPFGWDALGQLARFMRLNIIWPILIGPLISGAALIAVNRGRSRLIRERSGAPFVLSALITLALIVGVVAAIALATAQSQNVSFARFSTFFVPLLLLLAVGVNGWAMTWSVEERINKLLRLALPAILLVATILWWQETSDWIQHAYAATANSLRFVLGQDSLAKAYSHAESPYSFGGINPGALAAARQVPANTPIWSTNVDSYCMVPGCLIESVISFKMSGRLDEILGGEPDLAKRRLQEAGLNYFLFMSNYRILDLLPYSRLFSPETIGNYLGVKWTDGTTFLLTWLGPETSPMGPEILEAYKRLRSQPDNTQSFLFDELAPYISRIAPLMRSGQWRIADGFPWRQIQSGPIDVKIATYGESCRDFVPQPPSVNSVRAANATRLVRKACGRYTDCKFLIDVREIGDPAPGCGKDFSVEYRCGSVGPAKTASIGGEANGKTVVLDCADAPGSDATSR